MATTIFTPSTNLASNDSNVNTTFRNIITLTGGSTGVVRATFAAATNAGLVGLHCSVGISTGDLINGSTIATPVELTFSGGSGFTITSGQTITSDFVNLNFTSSDSLVIIIDVGNPGGNLFSSGETNCNLAFLGSATSWNVSSPTGFAHVSGVDYMVSSVETGTGTGLLLQSQICM